MNREETISWVEKASGRKCSPLGKKVAVLLAYGKSASFSLMDLDEVRVSKKDENSTEFTRYYVAFGRDGEGRNVVRVVTA